MTFTMSPANFLEFINHVLIQQKKSRETMAVHLKSWISGDHPPVILTRKTMTRCEVVHGDSFHGKVECRSCHTKRG